MKTFFVVKITDFALVEAATPEEAPEKALARLAARPWVGRFGTHADRELTHTDTIQADDDLEAVLKFNRDRKKFGIAR